MNSSNSQIIPFKNTFHHSRDRCLQQMERLMVKQLATNAFKFLDRKKIVPVVWCQEYEFFCFTNQKKEKRDN